MSIFKNKIKKKAYLYKADLKKKLINSYLHQTLEITYRCRSKLCGHFSNRKNLYKKNISEIK